jgi:hypothetical protein
VSGGGMVATQLVASRLVHGVWKIRALLGDRLRHGLKRRTNIT